MRSGWWKKCWDVAPLRCLFDVETDRRVAEFKLGRWTGDDGSRRKSVVKDLARLAAEPSNRRAEL